MMIAPISIINIDKYGCLEWFSRRRVIKFLKIFPSPFKSAAVVDSYAGYIVGYFNLVNVRVSAYGHGIPDCSIRKLR